MPAPCRYLPTYKYLNKFFSDFGFLLRKKLPLNHYTNSSVVRIYETNVHNSTGQNEFRTVVKSNFILLKALQRLYASSKYQRELTLKNGQSRWKN